MPSAPTRVPASMLEGVAAEVREGDAAADSEGVREGAPLEVLQGGAEGVGGGLPLVAGDTEGVPVGVALGDGVGVALPL